MENIDLEEVIYFFELRIAELKQKLKSDLLINDAFMYKFTSDTLKLNRFYLQHIRYELKKRLNKSYTKDAKDYYSL